MVRATMHGGGMIGRSYRWQGRVWRVIARWRTPSKDEPYTWACPVCGHLAIAGHYPRLDDYLGEDSYCGACGERWTETRPAGHRCLNGWQPGGRAVVRNVLIEDVETGQRVVRPFRGLRKAAA